MPRGGDIIEVTYNHPTLGNGVFFAKAGEDSTYDTGGFRSNDDDQMIDGSGEMIDQMNRKRPFFECVISNDMNDRNEYEEAVALAGDPVQGNWTIENKNGTVYGLRGKPVGEPQLNANQSTFTLKVAGSGQMVKREG